MLYPQHNPYRQVQQLATYWQIQFDPADQGLDALWRLGLRQGKPVAVPASWNDQFENSRDFLGPAWYQVQFDKPWGWDKQDIYLRFGSVNYLAALVECSKLPGFKYHHLIEGWQNPLDTVCWL